MDFKKSESGQVLILFAMSLAVLIGFTGLAIDTGLLYRARQNAQIAADAAAIATTVEYLDTSSIPLATAAGQAAATANGYTNGSNSTVVTINLPPASGWYQNSNYTEVIVSKPQPTNFMRIFGFNSMTVAARAVAGMTTPGNTCLWLTATNGTGLNLQGSYSINTPNCGIYINANDSAAIKVTGNGGLVNAKYVDVVGNSVPAHETYPTPVTPNATPRQSPWGNLLGPNPSSDCGYTYSGNSLSASDVNASWGSNSSQTVVCFTNKSGVTLSSASLPGSSAGVVYLFEYGVTIATGSTVTFGSCATCNPAAGKFDSTQGAVMDLYGGTLTQQSNSILSMYAPTAGTYNGIAILQPTSNTTNASSGNPLQVQFGSSGQVLDGYIYAPGSAIYLQDHGGGITVTGIVASTMYNKSSSITIYSYDLANTKTTVNRVISLVE